MNAPTHTPTSTPTARGGRQLDPASVSEYDSRVLDKLRRELGFMLAFLDEEDVQEILVNPDGAVFVDRAGKERTLEGYVAASKIASLLATVASSLHTTIDRERPYLDGVLILDGSRISGEIPPTVTAPSMRIRKHAKLVQPLDYFVETGTMSAEQLEMIRAALVAKKNLVIVGSTASGKTFLANSILRELAAVCPSDRVLTIEDTAELRLSSIDSLAWVTSPEVDMQLMLKRALRATPDRIVIGEVRGSEAYQLLKMWNTGHSGGLCTIHSDKGALDGLTRLERMCGESAEVLGMGRDWIRQLVGDVVHLLINIEKREGRRTIPRLVEVDGLDEREGAYRTRVFERHEPPAAAPPIETPTP